MNGNDDPRKNKKEPKSIKNVWGQKGAAGDTAVADWGMVDPVGLQALVSMVTARGALISFGYSRDGGAYLISVIENDSKHKEWIPANTDVDLAIQVLTDALR